MPLPARAAPCPHQAYDRNRATVPPGHFALGAEGSELFPAVFCVTEARLNSAEPGLGADCGALGVSS